MYMCMYACTCMSCIYSMSCQLIQKYMYVSIRSPSRHHLQVAVVSDRDDSNKGWKSLFENAGVIEVRELHEVFVHRD